MNLLGSQKFYVCTASCTMPAGHNAELGNPFNMMNAAIPPFDNMWIEWDEDDVRNMLSGVVAGTCRLVWGGKLSSIQCNFQATRTQVR